MESQATAVGILELGRIRGTHALKFATTTSTPMVKMVHVVNECCERMMKEPRSCWLSWRGRLALPGLPQPGTLASARARLVAAAVQQRPSRAFVHAEY